MTPSQLTRIGKQLYGYGWQTRIAKELGVNDRTVRNWLSGRSKIRPTTSLAVKDLQRNAN